METIDCAILYEWEYDDDFVAIVSEKLFERKISHKVYHAVELPGIVESVKNREMFFRCVIDRASDVDDHAEAIVTTLKRRGARVINDPAEVRHASDKASMHLEFITAGIYVPYTTIISPYNAQKEVKLSLAELARLGRPFIIKPANTTGGGIGVVTGAEGLQEVVETRQHNKDDKYLLQRRIEPVRTNGRRAWFRPFYVFGKVVICWWDDQTHLYFESTEEDITRYRLQEIDDIVRRIYDVCKLEFFSTELALADDGKFIVIDYVNEMCDMRVKSKHYDGVPDIVVEHIAAGIASGVRDFLERKKPS